MARPGWRQSRLDVGDPSIELAERWANYRTLRKAFVSATALATFHHCAAKPFIERILVATGVAKETWAMRLGAQAHEEVQSALAGAAQPSRLTLREALQERQFFFATEYALRDERRMMRGIADLVFAEDGRPHIVELKNARAPGPVDPTWNLPVRPEHAVQLEFYGSLLLGETGIAPRLTLVYLAGGSKATLLEEVAHGRDARAALLALSERHPTWDSSKEKRDLLKGLLRELRRAERRLVVPFANHSEPGKCVQCSVRSWCPRRLDRPDEFQHISAALLETRA